MISVRFRSIGVIVTPLPRHTSCYTKVLWCSVGSKGRAMEVAPIRWGKLIMSIRTFIMCSIVSFGFVAFAEDEASQSKVKIDEVTSTPNKMAGDDVDETLTNAKLRAETGSKSRFSIATAFNYDGGSFNKPLAADRPNIQGVTGATTVADLNGTINAKYNITQKDSILVGGGLRWVTPLQGAQRPRGYDGQMFDVYDPSVNYQRIYKIGNVQSYFQVGPTFYTRTNLTGEGYIANLGIYNVNAYEIGATGITIGLESGAGAGFYKAPAPYGNMSADDVRDDESDYNGFLYPYLEYQITDKINFRTVSFLLSYEHTRLHPMSTFRQDKVIQSAGIGFSVTRDVFLYPNIQFVPDQLRPEDTNVGISANINIF